jgi:hypothetical protein
MHASPHIWVPKPPALWKPSCLRRYVLDDVSHTPIDSEVRRTMSLLAGQGVAVPAGAANMIAPSTISGSTFDLDADATGGFSLSGSAVISWTDQIGSHAFTDQSVSGRRPTKETDSWYPGSGLPSVLSDGSDDMLTCEDGFANSFVGGADNTYALVIVGQMVTVPSGHNVFFSVTNQTTITQFVDWGKDTDTGPFERWRVARVDDTGANSDRLFGTPDTNRYVWLYNFHGTTIHTYRNAVVVDGTPGGLGAPHNVGALTLDRATVFGRFRGTATIAGHSNSRIRRIYAWSGDIAHYQAIGVSRWFMAANHVS